MKMNVQPDTFLNTLELRRKGVRTGVFATQAIPIGEMILRMQGALLQSANRYSIQVDDALHLDRGGLIDDEMNHSCNASAYIDFSDPQDLVIRALREISAGEEATINYCATEEEMTEPFECECGSFNCYGVVRGFKYLDAEQKRHLEGQLSPYLRKKYCQ